MKNICEITLYDLMAEDLDVWVSVNSKFGFDLDIDGDNGEKLIRKKGIHPYCADSFAEFCRSYLKGYDRALSRRNS